MHRHSGENRNPYTPGEGQFLEFGELWIRAKERRRVFPVLRVLRYEAGPIVILLTWYWHLETISKLKAKVGVVFSGQGTFQLIVSCHYGFRIKSGMTVSAQPRIPVTMG